MTPPELNEPATSRQLLRGTLTALLVAGILLVAVVLPAEYGIDPTGVGRSLGFYRPPAPEPITAAAPVGTAATPRETPATQPLFTSQTSLRSDEMSLVLQSGEGAEIKAAMNQGARMVFAWIAEGGVLEVDMHGEKAGAAEGEFTSYWKGQAQSGQGAFDAPFAGTHGWYWENLGSQPVTVKVKTSGFYQKLFKP